MAAFYMEPAADTTTARARLAIVASAAAIGATLLMTWPLVTDLSRLGRTENSGDARFAVWNVAWVAHALITNPRGLFDANIFYPHRTALAYSEANIGAGTLALPVWWLTQNAITSHNAVLLFAFAASVVTAWLLARRLTGDGPGAATTAVLFAFCPYMFAHTAHIQLLMIAGIPLCMLLLHELVDAPSARSGLALGLALAAQALSCAYYGIFVGLAIGYSTLFYAWTRRYWTSKRYWIAIALAAATSIAIVTPFFLPYLAIQRETGFTRSLEEAGAWSAYWRSYLASGAHAHAWLLPIIRNWNEAVLFPGFLAVGLGAAGGWIAVRTARSGELPSHRFSRDRETALLYGSIGMLALWASLGPRAGLYSLFYNTVPVFSFLRAPERMGILVTLALAVFAAFAVRTLGTRFKIAQGRGVPAIVCALALIELNDVPFNWRVAEPIPMPYRALAQVPRGALVEFPFYDRRIDFHIHTRYMLNSTVHWQPLVNGYSDHIPAEFRSVAGTLASFPSRESFQAMRDRRVRYLSIHWGRHGYGGAAATDIQNRLQPYLPNLKLVAEDPQVVIYEIISWP